MVALYGITQSEKGGVQLIYDHSGNVGSRGYLLDGENYYMFKLKNREFTATIDLSTLPCGIDASLYFVEMPIDGGKAANPTN